MQIKSRKLRERGEKGQRKAGRRKTHSRGGRKLKLDKRRDHNDAVKEMRLVQNVRNDTFRPERKKTTKRKRKSKKKLNPSPQDQTSGEFDIDTEAGEGDHHFKEEEKGERRVHCVQRGRIVVGHLEEEKKTPPLKKRCASKERTVARN